MPITHRYVSTYQKHSLSHGFSMAQDGDGKPMRVPHPPIEFTPVKLTIDGKQADRGVLMLDETKPEDKAAIEVLEGSKTRSKHAQLGRSIKRVSEAEWLDYTQPATDRQELIRLGLEYQRLQKAEAAKKK